MKRTELAKQKALSLRDRLKASATPERFGSEAPLPASRREQRERERAQGLVPFAVKLDAALAKRLQDLARERGTGLNELVAELLEKALGDKP